MKKTTLIFYELHPINLLPILIASVFFRVVYWQSVFIPKWLQKRFEQIYQPGDFTQGEWGVKTASIFFQLKKIFPKNFYNKKVLLHYEGQSIDLTHASMQSLVMKYERVKHLYCLVDFWLSRQPTKTKYFVVDFLENKNLDDIHLSARDNKYSDLYLFNSYLDMLWGVILSLLMLASQVKSYLSPSISPCYDFSKEKIKFYWHCLSEYEIASKENSLDITNLTQNATINLTESLLILHKRPNSKERLRLSKNKVKWTYEKDIFKFSLRKDFVKNILKLINISFSFRFFSGEKALIRQIKPKIVSNLLMLDHFKRTGASTLISGQSHGLQEKAIVTLVRALGKKTIYWSNAGLGAKSYPDLKLNQFDYEQIEGSITLSEIKFIWNKLDMNTLLKRKLNPLQEDQTKFIISGPLMSGDSSWLKIAPSDARKKYGGFNGSKNCKLWITLFDISVHIHNTHRWPVGLITEEVENQFFKDIGLLLNKYQDVGIIYKPKRPNLKNFILSKEKLNFLSEHNPDFLSNRIVKLEFNSDPYIPGSLGDVAISMPYSTSLLSVIASKKDGGYYDPSSNLGFAYPEIMNSLIISSYEELSSKVELWLNSTNTNKTILNEKLEIHNDPVEFFASFIK